MPVGKDGRIHTTFTHNPSSLRLSSVDPNLQNIPRGVDSEVEHWVKEIFVAPAGSVFWARDFSGIEAKLVGYFAGSARYTRLASLGVHAFLASHILKRPADISWSDADLRECFKEVKKDKSVYDKAKRTVHASNYMVSPNKLVLEFPEVFPTSKEAKALQGLYFDLFPEIRDWHKDLCLRVDGTKRKLHNLEDNEDPTPWTLGVCHAVNPFGYLHRFYNVLDWVKDEDKGEWLWEFGEDAKRLISFLPQSTAAAIIKRAVKRIWYEFPGVAATLRLLIHDEIFGEVGLSHSDSEQAGDGCLHETSLSRRVRPATLEECLTVSQQVMEEPIPELPLDPGWGMGEFLSIGTEAKVGASWAAMK